MIKVITNVLYIHKYINSFFKMSFLDFKLFQTFSDFKLFLQSISSQLCPKLILIVTTCVIIKLL